MLGHSYFRYKIFMRLNNLLPILLVSIYNYIPIKDPVYSFQNVQNANNLKSSKLEPFKIYGTDILISENIEKELQFNHIYESSYNLKEIPESKSKGNNSIVKKNPFIKGNNIESNTSYFLSNLKVSGIITIGNKLLTIVSSIYGTDTFEAGERIGDDYIIQKISTDPASVLISNGKNSKLFMLEE